MERARAGGLRFTLRSSRFDGTFDSVIQMGR
jgi:hypothetical protein